MALALLCALAVRALSEMQLQFQSATNRVYPLVGSGLCALGVVFLTTASGCGLADSECTAGDRRCNGGEIEECTTHPSGTDVSGDPVSVSHHDSSPNDWYAEGSCGSSDLCKTSTYTDEYGATKADAFCALDANPDPACGGSSSDGCTGESPSSTLVSCRDGFPVERKLCNTCDGKATCNGGVDGKCETDGDCAAGLACVSTFCVMNCTCPEGAPCAACNALDEDSAGPTQGSSFTWICQSGRCSEKFSD